jgi:hypothetical protein
VKEVIPWETEEEALSMVSVGVQRFPKKKYKPGILNDGGDEDSAEQYIQLDTDGRPVVGDYLKIQFVKLFHGKRKKKPYQWLA